MKTMPVKGENVSKMAKALARTVLFRSLPEAQLGEVAAAATMVSASPGEVIVEQGAAPDAFYVILKGEAAVEVGGNEVGRLKTREGIGEMGVILDTPRTATVKAHTEVLLLRMTQATFKSLFARNPEFGLGICRSLADRLAETSRRVPVESHRGEDMPSAEVVSMIPFDFVQRHRALPLHASGSELVVGFVDDVEPSILARLKKHLPSMTIRPAAITAAYFNKALAGYGSVAADAPKAREKGPGKAIPLDPLLRRMVGEGVSDLHLSAGWQPRWRIDGDVKVIGDAPRLGPESVYEMLRPVMDERWQKQFEETNDCDFAYSLEGVARFRVNLFRDHRGIGAVLRTIPAKILTFEQLGLPEAVAHLCSYPKGLVLVTGPTGSGKSTTLAAMIDYINKTRSDHIITLEDPVEFVHDSHKCLVNQREIGTHTRSFRSALKAALREDPDIVLVGELRDLETVEMALETANTGHLVFGTLHTATAISTVDRIVDLFPSEQQNQIRTGLSEALRGVVAQTLCKRIGGGRIAALEVLMADHAVANMVREGKTGQIINIMQTQKRKGNQVLNDELARLVREGIVDREDAMMRAVDKEGLARLIQ